MMVALYNMHVRSYCTSCIGNPFFGIQLIAVCGTETEGLKYTMLTHSHNQKTIAYNIYPLGGIGETNHICSYR